jgi:hypothetical protein
MYRFIDFAAAFISNGNAHVTSQRLRYIEELRKYVKVDVYGAKGNSTCRTKFKNENKTRIENINYDPHDGICKSVVYGEYKFYFSFENCLCNNYITEKFFLVIRHPIIPVVLGAGPYEFYVIFKKR